MGAVGGFYYLNGLLVGPVPSAPPACLWGKLLVLSPYSPNLPAPIHLPRRPAPQLSLFKKAVPTLEAGPDAARCPELPSCVLCRSGFHGCCASLSCVCASQVRTLATSLAGGNLRAQARTGRLGRSREEHLGGLPKEARSDAAAVLSNWRQPRRFPCGRRWPPSFKMVQKLLSYLRLSRISLKNGLCFLWCLF